MIQFQILLYTVFGMIHSVTTEHLINIPHITFSLSSDVSVLPICRHSSIHICELLANITLCRVATCPEYLVKKGNVSEKNLVLDNSPAYR